MRLTSIHIILVLALAAGCSKQKPSSVSAATSRLTVTQLDGGPITVYDSKLGRGGTRPARDTDLHRSSIVINDSSSPLQITDAEISIESPNMADWAPVRDVVLEKWIRVRLQSRSTVMASQIHALAFDVRNKKLWDEEFVKDFATIAPAAPHTTTSIGVGWNRDEAAVLAEWVTCVVYVEFARTADGKVWNFDQKLIDSKVKDLFF
jgi:hypothetical protein